MDDEIPKRPHGTALKQQQLRSVFAYSTLQSVSITLGIVAIVFVGLAAVVLVGSDKVVEVTHRYDHVNNYKFAGAANPIAAFADENGNLTRQGQRLVFNFTVPKLMSAPVYMYYGLERFYQNFREYRNSRSMDQLSGINVDPSDHGGCVPFLAPSDAQKNADLTVNGASILYSDFTYSPCGLGAWSMFNDSFTLKSFVGGESIICNGSAFDLGGYPTSSAPCRKRGISFPADREVKFKQPPTSDRVWAADNSHLSTTDVFLQNGWYAKEAGHPVPRVTDEDFQVWMRSAPLPSFKKTYRIIDVDLEKGDYQMIVDEYFDVASFKGKKLFTLTSRAWVGGRNYFVGLLYLVVGCLAFVFSVSFLARGLLCPPPAEAKPLVLDDVIGSSRDGR